jgi:glutamate-1-semialdehyde 2,1-aminomutase
VVVLASLERYCVTTKSSMESANATAALATIAGASRGREDYPSLPYGAGIPQPVADLAVPVPFNDAGAMERRIERLFEEGRPPACVIMGPAMMNLGIVLPEPGYLVAVRELAQRLGVVLIFDEVKTGQCVAAGGATERFGVTPDLVTLAKTLGGGVPTGATGGSEEVFEVVERGDVYQVGTFNGNPLVMAAARASLLEVLTPEAYAQLEARQEQLVRGCQEVIDRYGFSGYAVGLGAKGCVTLSPEPVIDHETFKAHQDGELSELALLYNMNRGVFATPGREEEWTISVAHTREHCEAVVAACEEPAADLTA